MFTRIEPLIQAVTRKTEKTDSHMGLGSDESIVDDRKKNEGRTAAKEWEDMTEVSVLALRGFLQELIGVSSTAAPMNITMPSSPVPAENSAPVVVQQNPAASRAARAYQTTGRAVHDRNVVPEKPQHIPPLVMTPSAGTSAVTGNFSADEIELIQAYITALAELEQKGVESVYLSRSSTFLESIRDAIAAAQ